MNEAGYDEEEATALFVGISRAIVRSVIIERKVDIRGMEQAEGLRAIAQKLRELVKEGLEFGIVADHRSDLLNEARRASTEEKYITALIIYATWTEHWINRIIKLIAAQRGMDYSLSKSVMREVSFRGKITWLIQLLELPKLNDDIIKSLTVLHDQRNSYVHYKWREMDLEKGGDDFNNLKNMINNFEATVENMHTYEEDIFMNDHSDWVRELLRS